MRKKLVKDLVSLERKLNEIDELLSKARVMINGMFWDIKIRIDKKKK